MDISGSDDNSFPEIPSTSTYDDDNIPEIDTQNQVPLEFPARDYTGRNQ